MDRGVGRLLVCLYSALSSGDGGLHVQCMAGLGVQIQLELGWMDRVPAARSSSSARTAEASRQGMDRAAAAAAAEAKRKI